MTTTLPTRKLLPSVLGGLAFAAVLLSAALVPGQPPGRPAAPIERRGPEAPHRLTPPRYSGNSRLVPGRPSKTSSTSRRGWTPIATFRSRSSKSALENEPGFRSLKPQDQQRMHARLQQLNSLPPQQQQRVSTARNAWSSSPQRSASRSERRGQLGSLPEDRRRAVAAASIPRSTSRGQRQPGSTPPDARPVQRPGTQHPE